MNKIINPKCKLCGGIETTHHIFECPYRTTVWMECMIALHPTVNLEMSPMCLITNPPNDLFVQSLIHETTHEIWLARNRLLYEGIETPNSNILAKITSNLNQIDF